MHSTTSMAAKAASLILLAGSVAAEPFGWGSDVPALATVTPCTDEAFTGSFPPVTVTSQYQTVSSCTPTTACVKGGACSTSVSCSEYPWVSTVIPCDGSSSTTVTSTDQKVTVSNWATTITSYATPTHGRHWKHKPKVTPVYSTIAKQFVCPYNEIGSFAIPGYEGSGLCDDCSPQADGSSYQEVDVIECHSGPAGPSCVEYVETWVSSSAPATSAAATGVCSTHAYAPSAGTWTYTFPFTAPAPSVTSGPDGWSYDPKPWFYYETKTCDGPSDWIITTTVTNTVTFTVPPSTQTPTSSTPCPIPTGPAGKPSFPGWPTGPAQPSSTPVAPGGGKATAIQVFDSGAKYHSNSPKYIGFSDEDGIIVTDLGSAAWFVFGDDTSLTADGAFVGADSAWGYAPFQKYGDAPNVYKGWSQSGSSVSWAFGGGSASFCVTGDNHVFISLTGSPSFACKPVDLSCGSAPPTPTSSSSTTQPWSTTSSWATPDPSSDPDPTDDAPPVVTEAPDW